MIIAVDFDGTCVSHEYPNIGKNIGAALVLKALVNALIEKGYKVLTGGTDNHEFLVDLRVNFPELTGKEATELLQQHEITVNKNMLPTDTRTPLQTSGIRIGTPAVTTLGYKESDMRKIADRIDNILSNRIIG